MSIKVGVVCQLKVPCLGNDIGTFGVCYDVYELSGRAGYSFIFQNGNYDGFSPDEVKEFLDIVAIDSNVEDYVFTNVIQLTKDWKNGKLGLLSFEYKMRKVR